MFIITPRLLTTNGLADEQMVFDIDTGHERQLAAQELPRAFHPLRARVAELPSMSSWTFYKLRTVLKAELDHLEEFSGLAEHPALASMKATQRQWHEFALFSMRRIDQRFSTLLESETATLDAQTVEGIKRFVRFCSSKMIQHWQNEHGLLRPMYDIEGVQAAVAGFATAREQYRFLKTVLQEMADPLYCEMISSEERAGKTGGPALPAINIVWQHALPQSDIVQIERMMEELRAEIEQEFRQAISARSTIAQSSGNREEEDHKNPKLLSWKGKQADLIYVMDRLIEAGLLEATSAEITEHFDYGSNSKTPSKTYRDMRKKLKDGQTYPSKEMISRLIEALQRDLR